MKIDVKKLSFEYKNNIVLDSISFSATTGDFICVLGKNGAGKSTLLKCISKKKDDEAYLKINIEAAKEAARQIRLRNLSGIILVDFINMDTKESMDVLLELFEKELKKDPIATTLVDVTKLQLVEVTRKKVRRPLHEVMS